MKNREVTAVLVKNIGKERHPVFRNEPEEYVPEYVKMNIEPEVYIKRQPIVQNNSNKTKTDEEQLPHEQDDMNDNLKKIPFSGQNGDNLWTDGLESERKSEKDPNEEVFYDEDVVEKDFVPQEEESSEEDSVQGFEKEDDSFTFNTIESGSFVLLLNDQVVDVGTSDKVKSKLLEMISSGEYDIDDFCILKKINIKWGVFLDE